MLESADLLKTVYVVVGSEFEVILTEDGWRGRRRPVGFKRPALLTAPCETPEQAEEALRRRSWAAQPEP